LQRDLKANVHSTLSHSFAKTTMMKFKVSSSHGHLIVNSINGEVLECYSDGSKEDYLPDIARFDIDRFRKTQKNNSVPDDVDILRFGFYNKDGTYETPAEGYEADRNYALFEAIADISFFAAKENYRTDDSREMISQFIEWAKDFEYLHKKIVWGVNSPLDYLESIHLFTLFKINQWRST
jgi:hypothetical protein